LLNLDSSDYIALFALLFSIYATYKSQKFSSIQNQLNLLMIDKEKRESLVSDKADLGANFTKVGNKSHRLKIFNKGKGKALNINIDFPEGNDLIAKDDINSKFPLELLEYGQSLELISFPHMGSKKKLAVKLNWSNENGTEEEKTLYPTW